MFALSNGNRATFGQVRASRVIVTLGDQRAAVCADLDLHVLDQDAGSLFASVSAPELVVCDGWELEVMKPERPCPNGVWATAEPIGGSPTLTVASTLTGVFGSVPDGLYWRAETTDSRSGTHYFDRVAASGFEHDAYPITMEVRGIPRSHQLHANGSIERFGDEATISFPAWYSPACPWWVLAPESFARRLTSVTVPWSAYDGTSGDTLPVIVLAEDPGALDEAVARTVAQVERLVERFGPWPHPAFQLLLARSRSMEYAGAAVSRLAHIEHEVSHSYFGRCVMPRDGASGWIDEGIATWLEFPPVISTIGELPETDCGYGEPWTRGGLREGYHAGAALLSLVDHRLAGTNKSTDGFLRDLLASHRWRAIGTPEFLSLLRAYAGPWVNEAAARAILCGHG